MVIGPLIPLSNIRQSNSLHLHLKNLFTLTTTLPGTTQVHSLIANMCFQIVSSTDKNLKAPFLSVFH